MIVFILYGCKLPCKDIFTGKELFDFKDPDNHALCSIGKQGDVGDAVALRIIPCFNNGRNNGLCFVDRYGKHQSCCCAGIFLGDHLRDRQMQLIAAWDRRCLHKWISLCIHPEESQLCHVAVRDELIGRYGNGITVHIFRWKIHIADDAL